MIPVQFLLESYTENEVELYKMIVFKVILIVSNLWLSVC
jgi:hypothetical protein